MSDVKFNFKPADKKSNQKYIEGNKYDPIINAFNEGRHNLVKVEVGGMDAKYLRTQLYNRIVVRNLTGIKVSIINNSCYLEKI